MNYQPKKRALDPAALLFERRQHILAEYRHFQLAPIRIGTEPISLELALLLGLIVDTQAAAE